MLERSTFSLSSKGEWSSSPRDGCLKCGGAHFQRDCNASNRLAKAIKASHGPRVSTQSQAKERVNRAMENPKGSPKGKSKGTEGAIQVSRGSGNCRTLKTGISDLENLKPETILENQESVYMGQVCITETSWIHEEWNPDEWNDDGSLDEWNDDWSGVGWHEDCEQTYNTSVSSLSLESSEWVSANLDTGATVDTFSVNFDRKGKGDGSFFDWITDVEGWQSQGYDEKCKS